MTLRIKTRLTSTFKTQQTTNNGNSTHTKIDKRKNKNLIKKLNFTQTIKNTIMESLCDHRIYTFVKNKYI